ncbi:MAG: PAS domain S-box protein [Deltaproteobacteria bacterium]|nr:PAS domain S-box protein [Deltaproteobacteria bacterium]
MKSQSDRKPGPGERTTDAQAAELYAAQVRQVYSQSVPGLIAAQLSALLLMAVLWRTVPHWQLLVWLAAYFVLQVIRNLLVWQFRRVSPSGEKAIPWGPRFVWVTVASGLVWGSAGVFLFPANSILHQFILALFLAGLSAAAAVVYAPLKSCNLPTVIAEILPIALRCLYELDYLHVIIGTIMLAFGTVLVLTGRYMHAVNENSLKLGFEKTELLKSVLEQQKQSDQLNKELISQIEERRKAQQGLVESEARFRELAELLPQLAFELDLEGNFAFVNRAGLEMMGRTSNDLAKGLAPAEVCSPEDWERAQREFEEVFEGKSLVGAEYKITRGDGSSIPVVLYANPITRKGKVVGVRGVGVDVSELKSAQRQLAASLQEKEILLREIHHRVKNNLQVICSLLRVQKRSLDNDQHAEMFQESENRIRSMATVYEKLYQSRNLSELNARDYLNSVVRHIQATYESIGTGIEVSTDLDDLTLNTDSAISLGLIMTELVSNSLKHAFPNDGKGRIDISFRALGNDRIELKVRDNGIGLPQHIDVTDPDTVGLRLVRIFVEQLGGEFHISGNNGTSASIEFENPQIESAV